MTGETTLTIVGNLTADPELRYTQAGHAVANFTIASTPSLFDKASGQWKDGEPLFLRASVWRDYAENVAKSLKKGTRVIATGRLRMRRYETDSGEKRTSTELEIDDIGPALRWATAEVARSTPEPRPQSTEEWAPSSSEGGTWSPGYSDETPF